MQWDSFCVFRSALSETRLEGRPRTRSASPIYIYIYSSPFKPEIRFTHLAIGLFCLRIYVSLVFIFARMPICLNRLMGDVVLYGFASDVMRSMCI